jgi:hypothetical protein
MSKHYFYIITGNGGYTNKLQDPSYSLFATKKTCRILKPHWKIKILRTQFAQPIVLDQHLEEVMICSYLMMLLRITIHTQILIVTTKLHLVSATHSPSWQEHITFNRQKLKFSTLSRIYIYLNIYSCTKYSYFSN